MWKVCLPVVLLLVVATSRGFQPIPAVKIPQRAAANADRSRRAFVDPPKVRYEQSVDSVLEETYKWQENKRVAVLCPKGTFIAAVSFVFSGMKKYYGSSLQNFKLNDIPQLSLTNREIVLKRQAGEKKSRGFWNAGIGDSPGDALSSCDPVLFCLGFQACLFKATIDVCANDPMPGQRKLLDMRVTCATDSTFSQYFQADNTNNRLTESVRRRHDQVLYIYVNDDNTDDVAVSLLQVTIPEEDIFGISCPVPREAYNAGYGGVCTLNPPSHLEMVNTLWSILGRVPSDECRTNLIEAYCSYHYNTSGGCIPPALLQHPGGRQPLPPGENNFRYSFQSLPSPGSRPDLTEHEKLVSLPHANLIPARLAFALLVHEYPETVMQLLQSVYKPYFYYCIHVDKRAEEIRQVLIEKTQFADNIHILPKDRSFVASWGSYEIVRAELECFEELLRMGAWDFIINLSGADLPIRDVDDVAASLAPARGHTFLRKNGRWRDRKDKITDHTVWYSCDAHVYNASYRGDRPAWADMYSASQWGIYGRNFADFVVSADRGWKINNLQYFAQTCIIPDESYMMSNLMISEFRHTYLPGHLHHLKNFDSRDEFGFCRHTEDIDFCGQGPGIFDMSDVSKLQLQSSNTMFARKFDYENTNKVRLSVLQWVKYGFYDNMEAKLGQENLRAIVQHAITYKYGLKWKEKIKFGGLVKWQVLPQIYHSNPCCRLLYGARNVIVHETRYWVDFKVTELYGNNVNQTKILRAAVSPRSHSECFSDGHMRALQISSLNKAVGKVVGTPPEKATLSMVPYETRGSNTIYLNALFRVPKHTDEELPNEQCDDSLTLKKMMHNSDSMHPHNYARFTIGTMVAGVQAKTETLEFNATLFEPSGRVRCSRIMKFTHTVMSVEQENARKGKPMPEMTTYSNSFANCGSLGEGLWMAKLVEVNKPNAFPYMASVYIANGATIQEVKDIPQWLWQMEGITELPENGQFYDFPEMPMNPFEATDNEEAYLDQLHPQEDENEGGIHLIKRNADPARGVAPQDGAEAPHDQEMWVRRAMGHGDAHEGVNLPDVISIHKDGTLVDREQKISNSSNSFLEKFLKILLISTILVIIIKTFLNPMKLMKRSGSGTSKFFVFVVVVTLVQLLLYTMLFSL
ncbi:uncharacterized protein [Ptychodera flava]|uniref:uncharacterized protein n=1 Tax=Ptychodera flava TaxID=63121 RepID=UPI00396AAFFD